MYAIRNCQFSEYYNVATAGKIYSRNFKLLIRIIRGLKIYFSPNLPTFNPPHGDGDSPRRSGLSLLASSQDRRYGDSACTANPPMPMLKC